ncbi:unnamed protein product [Meganyctiphanes norvegica]|uniref:SH2 domain-containing protein n=1 Tax=Meganyctiphanes norvegica TaxID=48144 RepID=A0AAV2RKR1_MEGNR
MGRLKSWGSNLNPLFSGKYKKLLEEYGTKDYSRLLLQDSLQDYLSYACRECGHVQKLQAEELNSIVSHAFRLAYAAHLQKSASDSTSHKFDLVIPTSQHLAPPHTPAQPPTIPAVAPSNKITPTHKHRVNRHQKHCQLDSSSNNQTSSPSEVGSVSPCGSDSMLTPGTLNPVPTALCMPSSLPGAHPHMHRHQYPLPSENTNSPTVHSSSQRYEDKPTLQKKPVNLENSLEKTLDNNLENTLEINFEIDDDLQPLVITNTSSSSPSCHQLEQVTSSQVMSQVTTTPFPTSSTSTVMAGYANEKVSDSTSSRLPIEAQCHDHNIICNHLSDEAKMKCISQISLSSSVSSGVLDLDLSTSRIQSGIPPPLPDRSDSLTPPEEPHLTSAAWFQAGIPREIALEVLSREPVGAFMVRESTSKPGCYALSLRVPRDFTVSGIAHYLIVKNCNGYKIKGFTKEFTTLTALITHHSVMPEFFPCPLSLSRYNPTFTNNDQNRADQNDEDPDYNTLSDFRKIMADLNV